MIAAAKSEVRQAQFPQKTIEAALIKWWAEEALERSDDPFAPVPNTSGTIYELLPSLDSLTIVRSFLVIEKILEINVPVSLVKPGGYHSREEMLTDLMPKLRRYWEKRQ
jgi:hypothetical protein